MKILKMRPLIERVRFARMCLWAVCFSLGICLGGCVTVYKSDEDASQGRDGVGVSAFDIIDAAAGRQK